MVEYGPVKGKTNIVDDALSRLNIESKPPMLPEAQLLAECFGADAQDKHMLEFLIQIKHLYNQQLKDKMLAHHAQTNPAYQMHTFHGGGKLYNLICHHDKIAVPSQLQQATVDWYHNILCHPGINQTEQTIRQHFWWKN